MTNFFKVYRHLGNSLEREASMLETLDVSSLDELIDQTVPAKIKLGPNERFKVNGKEL